MYFCGLDVSLSQTALCVVDRDGKIVKECKVASCPEVIAGALSRLELEFDKIGL